LKINPEKWKPDTRIDTTSSGTRIDTTGSGTRIDTTGSGIRIQPAQVPGYNQLRYQDTTSSGKPAQVPG